MKKKLFIFCRGVQCLVFISQLYMQHVFHAFLACNWNKTYFVYTIRKYNCSHEMLLETFEHMGTQKYI